MPLADMVLVRHVDTADAAPRRSRGAGRDDDVRVLRCAAGFYLQERSAGIVADALGARFGLRPDQLTVIRPTGLTREGLAHLARRWQRLRPAQDGGPQPCWSWQAWWLAPGLWAGVIAGAVSSALAPRRPQRHRFDRVVARQLQRGFSVVVAHGLGEHHEAPVLAYLQDSSHSWAAEAPPLRQRR